jgi:ferredoxin
MPTVTINREECTSCTSCWETCPEVFEEDPKDGKSRITEALCIGGNPAKGKVSAELLTCVQDAADSCPVEIITVEV